jgi:type II secretory pathway component GspD/PulD (secretin)
VADLVLTPHNRNQQTAANGIPANPATPVLANPTDPSGLQAQAAAMDGTAGGSFPTFQPGSGGTMSGTMNRPITADDFRPLIELIKTSIAPGTWSDNHSSYDDMAAYSQGAGQDAGEQEGAGSITPFFLNISLIIRQTAEVHEEIVSLLRQLRRLQDLQVSVEVRFISVGDSFFEQIGVDFDFAIQSDAVGRKSSFAIPNPAAVPGGGTTGGGGGGTGTAVAPYLINPIRDHAYGREPLTVGTRGPTDDVNSPQFNPNLMIPFTQNTYTASTPFNNTTGAFANFGVAFLSDLEVYFFMNAIQGDSRSNVVSAPKVTSFNGAPAFIVSGTQRYYVAQLTPVIGAGAVAFAPTPAAINDGVFLNVTPVVSADRRYVRMTLSPNFTTIQGFESFTIPAAVGGGGLGGQSSTINGQIQLPIIQSTFLNTTVTVPDGGTVLLGGVKRLREERRELGVPILSKTPYIDRLFRNIGIGRTTDSLMLMVTPRIIILEEEEERLGIPPIQNVTF